MSKKQFRQSQCKNKNEVHHIHLKLGDRVYTIEHDGDTVDFEVVLDRLNRIYCATFLMI